MVWKNVIQCQYRRKSGSVNEKYTAGMNPAMENGNTMASQGFNKKDSDYSKDMGS